MRSIIFTSVLGCLATSAAAQAPEAGCFERAYAAAHLAAHPDQIVAKLRLLIYEQAGFSETLATLEVTLAEQGRVMAEGRGGDTLRQTLLCWTDAGNAPRCGVECDGGGFDIMSRDADGMLLRTDYLLVGTDSTCGGVVDLVEVSGVPVSYKLNAAEMARCEGMLPQ